MTHCEHKHIVCQKSDINHTKARKRFFCLQDCLQCQVSLKSIIVLACFDKHRNDNGPRGMCDVFLRVPCILYTSLSVFACRNLCFVVAGSAWFSFFL